MFGLTPSRSFDDFFSLQREVDRLFTRFWNDLPTRTASSAPGAFQVNATDNGWRIDVPLPGIYPQNVVVEVAGTTLSIRVEEADPSNKDTKVMRYEQTLTIPQFLDVERLSASHRHGMLQLMLPLKDSVKLRRVQIEHAAAEQKQLTAARSAAVWGARPERRTAVAGRCLLSRSSTGTALLPAPPVGLRVPRLKTR